MATRAPRQGRGRIRLAKSFQPTVPNLTWSAAITGGKVRVTVPSQYTINGVPNFTVQGVAPTAITAVSATQFDLTYAATPVSTNVFAVDGNDGAVRFQNGGYVQAGTFTFP